MFHESPLFQSVHFYSNKKISQSGWTILIAPEIYNQLADDYPSVGPDWLLQPSPKGKSKHCHTCTPFVTKSPGK